KDLRSEMKRAAGALAEALKLVERPVGRFPIRYDPNFIGTTLHCQDAREAANLMRWELVRRLADGDAEGAAVGVECILNASRAIGDEPTTISILVRIAVDHVAVAALERTLAHGQLSEPTLKRLQELFDRQAADPYQMIAARGERAGQHRLWSSIKNGTGSL